MNVDRSFDAVTPAIAALLASMPVRGADHTKRGIGPIWGVRSGSATNASSM